MLSSIDWKSVLLGALFVQFILPFLLGLLRRKSTPAAPAA